jgi:23S rRNA pseudouridine1911/1915/1917 synthase
MQRKNYKKPEKETVLTVKEETELMPFLLAKMGGMSRTSVKSLLSHRQVMVNGKIVTQYDFPLRTADKITVSSSRGNTELLHPKLKILYEDSHLIVVEKREGLLTVSTDKGEETTAFSILKNYVKRSETRNRIFVVHRLDRETSGVIMFAKNRDIQLALQENWHNAVTQRIYVALVEGRVEKNEDTVITYLTENPKSLKIHSSDTDNGGQQAITHYRTLKSNDNFSLLELQLETGRKNQIRVHLQTLGHPIAGDKKYGSHTSPIGRVGLHARVLAFIHPATNEEIKIESPAPKSFYAIFR